jgi:hypothetical protein
VPESWSEKHLHGIYRELDGIALFLLVIAICQVCSCMQGCVPDPTTRELRKIAAALDSLDTFPSLPGRDSSNATEGPER